MGWRGGGGRGEGGGEGEIIKGECSLGPVRPMRRALGNDSSCKPGCLSLAATLPLYATTVPRFFY